MCSTKNWNTFISQWYCNPQPTKRFKMEAYPEAVEKIIAIYVDKANMPQKKEQKIYCITGLFNYLSTADVKPILQTERFAKVRNILLRKIDDFSNHAYIVHNKHKYHRLNAVMRELFTFLVQDDSVPRRRSERQKQRAVRGFNTCFEHCSSPQCISVANELKQWSAVKPNQLKPVSIKVKVLPRRSARLLAKKE